MELVKAKRRATKRSVERNAETNLFSRQPAIDEAFLERTARLFEVRMEQPLSLEDSRQIVDNLGGFFRILAEWERIDRGK
ncbi:hypothetical protein LB543_24400 [Mesorhizobium sp. ESP7-2]|uniref:hypothetical protein n=1 Tax=Mesorhizobium sp. ESP7-2 TaxID=2876622 RepID=UPI001CCF2038|nr:hypothetical protein [Mesorhizobium sp. ESP7-2]MBZ9709851.1 hypothetical protein [Mesorhizobium sp. ESP7-2]